MSKTNLIPSLLRGAAVGAMVFAASAGFTADQNVLPTKGDNIETFWKSKFWTIFKNNSRQSCFIEWRSENSVVQAGLTQTQGSAYLGAFVKGYEPAEGEHDIAISLNGNMYVGSSTTVSRTLSGDLKGGYIVFDNPRFVSDLVEAREFIAFDDTASTVTVKLKTPQNAINRAQDCMETF
ncbi:hypothetical protein BXY66_1857 [Shimia isoporae]|uniref:Uncharacterized protein n=1 Tax=Shimia isoporae TaxID=647720 RepID=A0A4R1NX96_9RHOB|nr:hypothetical protein [Shimia isoporae]TCL09792.1 hypothetical protein BXY66_1857 [Shimia isoporae]